MRMSERVLGRYMTAIQVDAAEMPDPRKMAEPLLAMCDEVGKIFGRYETKLVQLNQLWAVHHGGRDGHPDPVKWAEINEKALPITKKWYDEVAPYYKEIGPAADKLLTLIKKTQMDQNDPKAYREARATATLMKKPYGNISAGHEADLSWQYASWWNALCRNIMILGKYLKQLLGAD